MDGCEFGVRLRTCRRSAGLSQEMLAERSGLSVRTISNLERGRARWPYRDTLRRLADALGLHGTTRTAFLDAPGCRPAASGPIVAPAAAAPSRPAEDERAVPHHPLPAAGGPIPRQLPAVAGSFVGRTRELAVLDRLLNQADPARADKAVVVSVIGGTAGVGKTALALYWAHSAAARFPDGQLYANLRGYDESGDPADAAEVMRGFLRALHVERARIPVSLDEQAALYRSLLAGKRMLVMLDNAIGTCQVRPLLPASPGCVVLVTSRTHLPGLVALEAARFLGLDVLTEREAAHLLRARLGAARTDAEPGAVEELCRFCACLPLALCIVAGRAAAFPAMALSHLAGELRDGRNPLDTLSSGEAGADVRAVFSWSYRRLDDQASRMFRLLSVHPGPDISVCAAADLADRSITESRTALRDLADAGLVHEHAPGRYRLHELLRAYSSDQAGPKGTPSMPPIAAP